MTETPTSGRVWVNGIDMTDPHTNLNQVRADIGMVFQQFNLFPNMNVIDNIMLALTKVRKLSRRKARQTALEALEKVGLREKANEFPSHLSGGQKQRVAIARALVSKPSIILADEPTGNLDSRSSHVIMEELAQLHKQGNTIIMVTHNPNLTSYASRVINMLDGKIASDTKIRIASGNESEKSVKVSLNARRAAKEEKSEARSAKKKPAKEAKNDDQPAANDPEPSKPDDAETSSSGQLSDQTERKKAES